MSLARRLPALVLSGALAACAPFPDGSIDEREAPPLAGAGLLAGAPPNEMLPLEGKADAIYPPRLTDLLAYQSPVKDQGQRGVCSIFTTVALMESLYAQAGRGSFDFSEQYLMWSVKSQLGSSPTDEASNAGENLRAVSKFGIPREAAWPYEAEPWGAQKDPACGAAQPPTRCFTHGDPPAAARTAELFRLPRGRWLNTASIKAHLAEKKQPVAVGVDFFYQAWNHGLSPLPRSAQLYREGVVTYPNDADLAASRALGGGHAVLIVGWDDDKTAPARDAQGRELRDAGGQPLVEKGFYLFKNSWGTDAFGVNNSARPGYGWISQRYVAQFGHAYVSDLPGAAEVPEEDLAQPAPVAIPDADPRGVLSTLTPLAGGAIEALTVSFDIAHPAPEQLKVILTHNDLNIALAVGSPGQAGHLRGRYQITNFNGQERSGPWSLWVIDETRGPLAAPGLPTPAPARIEAFALTLR